MLTLKATAVWLIILACAVANGALREIVLVPEFGHFTGLVLSGMLLCLWILLVSVLLVPWFGRQRATTLLRIGVLWVVLTITFEFAFGRLVQRSSWQELLASYHFRGGNLWPLVLLVTATAPWIAARIRSR